MSINHFEDFKKYFPDVDLTPSSWRKLLISSYLISISARCCVTTMHSYYGVVQGFLSWLCWNLPVYFQLQSIWLESLNSLFIKPAYIICSTLYVVIGFLQFVSIYLFKLYLVYVLTVANISMSLILFAKESQILFAKEFIWYFYNAFVELPILLVYNFKNPFQLVTQIWNLTKDFHFCFCYFAISNPSSVKFQKFISICDTSLEIDKGFSLLLSAILSEAATRNSVWIDFIDKFLLIDRFLLNFQNHSFTLSVIYCRYISKLM